MQQPDFVTPPLDRSKEREREKLNKESREEYVPRMNCACLYSTHCGKHDNHTVLVVIRCECV
jgi:hypothetical protein